MLQEFVNQISKNTEKAMRGIHTAMPGQVLSFDPATGLATVLPIMKFKKPDGEMIDYPQITGVPVVFPQAYAQQATVAYPVKPGDGCFIIIAEQSIDYWMYGQETDTDLAFDLTNAICIPGLFVKPSSVVMDACRDNAVIVDVKGTRLAVSDKYIQIDSEEIRINGNVTLDGKMNVTGGVSADDTMTIKGDVTMLGSLDVTGVAHSKSDVTADSISLKEHTHTGDSGGSTSEPRW